MELRSARGFGWAGRCPTSRPRCASAGLPGGDRAGPRRRTARRHLCARLPADLCRRARARPRTKSRAGSRRRPPTSADEDRACLPRPGAGTRRAGRRRGAARAGAGRRRLCRLVPALRRGRLPRRGRSRPCPERLAPLAEQAAVAPPARPARRAIRRCARAAQRRLPGQASRRSSARRGAAEPPSAAARSAAVGGSACRRAASRRGARPGRPRAPRNAGSCCALKADAWMQVRGRSGQVLLNRVLRPGETWPVPPKADPAADHRQCRGHRARRRRRGGARDRQFRARSGATCRSTRTLIRDGKLPAQVRPRPERSRPARDPLPRSSGRAGYNRAGAAGDVPAGPADWQRTV